MEQKAREIVYACAGCRIHRRECGDNCMLAPYFPPNDPHKFLLVNKLFGTKKILKILQDISVEKRADAVSSMTYEASARVQDPIYGCAGVVHRLQKQILQLQTQLATTQAELFNAQADLVSLTTGFYNCDGAGTRLGFSQDLVQHNDDLIVWDDDPNLFRWEEMNCSFK